MTKSSAGQVIEQRVCKHGSAMVLYLDECPLCVEKNAKSEREAALEKELVTTKARMAKLQSAPSELRKAKEDLANYKMLADKYVEENSQLEAKIKAIVEAAKVLKEFSSFISRLAPLEQNPAIEEEARLAKESDSPAPIDVTASPSKVSEDLTKPEVQQDAIAEEKDLVSVVPIEAESAFPSEVKQQEIADAKVADPAPARPPARFHSEIKEQEDQALKSGSAPKQESPTPENSDESAGLPLTLQEAVQQYKAVSEGKKNHFSGLKNKLKGI